MSEQRSSSAVRNLRNIFENKNTLDSSNSPDSRGRSPSGLSSDKENGGRRTSKVRASFVPVGPASMATTADSAGGARRGSFGEADGDLLELKKTISEQQDRKDVPEKALLDSAVPSAAVTPRKQPDEGVLDVDDSPLAGKEDKPPENPDKPVTGTEEEPVDMKPADPADVEAVSGGEALPPVAEDLRASTKPASSTAAKKAESKKPMTNGKPAAISTKAPTKPASSSVKSPISQPKTPSSANASSTVESTTSSAQKPPVKKASRSSLTAPTAASMAHTRTGQDKTANTKTSPTAKPKPREVTKPVNLPSHLTAPTASSRAKHDPEPSTTSTASARRTSTNSRAKPTASSNKTTSRSSLAPQPRPGSRGSESHARRSTAPVDSSFLDRMMKPTAASSQHVREKVESTAKSPPRAKATATTKPKVNGHAASKPAKASPKTVSSQEPEQVSQHEVEDEPTEPSSGVSFAGDATTADEAVTASEATGGNETPNAHTNGETDLLDGALEATPAGLGDEETIR